MLHPMIQLHRVLLASRLGGERSDRGASLVEYALLIVLVALVCIVAVTFFGSETSSSFVRTGDSIAKT